MSKQKDETNNTSTSVLQVDEACHPDVANPGLLPHSTLITISSFPSALKLLFILTKQNKQTRKRGKKKKKKKKKKKQKLHPIQTNDGKADERCVLTRRASSYAQETKGTRKRKNTKKKKRKRIILSSVLF